MQQIIGPLDVSRLGSSPLRAGIVYLKNWPVFYSAQGAVDAAIELREKVLLGRGATDAEKWAPKSRETADHSVPFCVAVALLDGALTSRTFDSERFLDKDVIELMAKITLREDPVFTKQYRQNGTAAWSRKLSRACAMRSMSHIPKAIPTTRFRIPRSRRSLCD